MISISKSKTIEVAALVSILFLSVSCYEQPFKTNLEIVEHLSGIQNEGEVLILRLDGKFDAEFDCVVDTSRPFSPSNLERKTSTLTKLEATDLTNLMTELSGKPLESSYTVERLASDTAVITTVRFVGTDGTLITTSLQGDIRQFSELPDGKGPPNELKKFLVKIIRIKGRLCTSERALVK